MKYFIYILFLFALSSLGILAVPGIVSAQVNLVVTFENTPLFLNTNILPGSSVTRWVKAENTDASASYQVAVKAETIDNSDLLGNQMTINIVDHNTASVYYSGTLTSFLNSSPLPLSLIAPGIIDQFDFTIDFLTSTDNDYQLKSVSFDIVIGIEEDDGRGSDFQAAGSDYGGNTLFPTNNPGSDSSSGPTIVAGESGEPKLIISKRSLKSFINPGDRFIPFEVEIVNQGNLSAFNAQLMDELPDGLVFSGSEDVIKTWPKFDIAPGQIQKYEYLLDSLDFISDGTKTNTVTLSSDNYPIITATADITVRGVDVLGEELEPTGFKIKEFLIILFFILILIIFSVSLKKNIV